MATRTAPSFSWTLQEYAPSQVVSWMESLPSIRTWGQDAKPIDFQLETTECIPRQWATPDFEGNSPAADPTSCSPPCSRRNLQFEKLGWTSFSCSSSLGSLGFPRLAFLPSLSRIDRKARSVQYQHVSSKSLNRDCGCSLQHLFYFLLFYWNSGCLRMLGDRSHTSLFGQCLHRHGLLCFHQETGKRPKLENCGGKEPTISDLIGKCGNVIATPLPPLPPSTSRLVVLQTLLLWATPFPK